MKNLNETIARLRGLEKQLPSKGGIVELNFKVALPVRYEPLDYFNHLKDDSVSIRTYASRHIDEFFAAAPTMMQVIREQQEVIERMQVIREQQEVIERLKGALVKADQFITNGIEFNYIALPSCDFDPANATPSLIKQTLAAIEAGKE